MSRAFVKEDDGEADGRCPRCSTIGLPVQVDTLDHHVKQANRHDLAATGAFCPNPLCVVVYFDDFGRTVEADQLNASVYPKDPLAPICACFGLTRADIDEDIAEGSVARCRETVEKSRSDQARCAVLAASGQSCVSEIQRYYQKAKSARS